VEDVIIVLPKLSFMPLTKNEAPVLYGICKIIKGQLISSWKERRSSETTCLFNGALSVT
jgi:hypothetical protein